MKFMIITDCGKYIIHEEDFEKAAWEAERLTNGSGLIAIIRIDDEDEEK